MTKAERDVLLDAARSPRLTQWELNFVETLLRSPEGYLLTHRQAEVLKDIERKIYQTG